MRALVIQYFGRTANNAIMVAIVFVLWLVPGVVAAVRMGRGGFMVGVNRLIKNGRLPKTRLHPTATSSYEGRG